MAAQADPGLLGTRLEDYEIEKVLGGGTYSMVYAGAHVHGLDSKAFKVAKPPSQITHPDPSDMMPTQALSFYTGGLARIKPDTYALLVAQGEKLRTVKDPSLVEVEHIVQQPELCYLRMELLEGKPLSHMMKERPVSLAVFVELARSLDRLSRLPQWRTHGDLKPDNVMLTESGVKILDPGYFGKLLGATGEIDCVVTTPAYYPLLKPDDLWAFGILLWHAAVGRHPLYAPVDEDTSAHAEEETTGASIDDVQVVRSDVGENLLGLVRSRQGVGQHFLDPLLRLRRPREIRAEMSEAFEGVVLKGMRLRLLTPERLELAEGYKDFAEFAEAIEELVQQGVQST